MLSPTQQWSHARRARRLQRYHRVRELRQQGHSQRAIARQLGLDRETVARFAHAEEYPERGLRPYPTAVDAFAGYLQQRWVEGCRNAVQLTQELAVRGFRGSYCTVRRYLNRWLRSAPALQPCSAPASPSPYRPPSAKRVAAWLLKPDAQLEPEQLAFVEALTRTNPDLTTAGMLAQEFSQLVRERRARELDDWITRAVLPRVPHELRIFAKGLRSDYAAVKAALSSDWSNGQVEGQVNRLKLIKRQMYGRAKFDLLRQRVLHRG